LQDNETPSSAAGSPRRKAAGVSRSAAGKRVRSKAATAPRRRKAASAQAATGDDPAREARLEAITAHLRDGTPMPAGQDPSGEPSPAPVEAAPAPQPAGTRAPAGPARVHRRHRGILVSFVILVMLPLLVTMAYLFFVAQDQYASTVGFTVRREEGATSSTELLGGLAQFAGGGSSSETDILYEYIQSQEVVAVIDERLGLGDLYAVHWPSDPLMSLWPDATIEQLHWFWGRMVRISYDQSTRLIELRVLAYSAEDAQRIATEIVKASQNRINDLNTQARSDVMRYANEDLETALNRLKAAREALSRFRTRTQIVDPSADIQGRMGVLNNLQQQLAQALIENDIVLGTTQEGDPRRQQAARRIQVIRDRIADERKTFSSDSETHIAGENYPALIAEFESLTVDLQFAEETYRAALAAVDVARANASRQNLYLAPYIMPTLPQTAEFPQRFVLSALTALFLLLAWSIGVLIYYSIRDRN